MQSVNTFDTSTEHGTTQGPARLLQNGLLGCCSVVLAEAGQPMVTCLVVAGGVAANTKVRTALQSVAAKYGLPCFVPPAKFCSDNGLMVAWTGVERLKLGLCRCVAWQRLVG